MVNICCYKDNAQSATIVQATPSIAKVTIIILQFPSNKPYSNPQIVCVTYMYKEHQIYYVSRLALNKYHKYGIQHYNFITGITKKVGESKVFHSMIIRSTTICFRRRFLQIEFCYYKSSKPNALYDLCANHLIYQCWQNDGICVVSSVATSKRQHGKKRVNPEDIGTGMWFMWYLGRRVCN